ncbi:ComEA family DNA-binding protein [[Clostridium] colinum]|uniref:ComEA family DNA-binding protein n=1 Tax=[Clostridium] colinum TaxID=36835 RepID=UPI0020256184|nr:helix-hairpin-helix domain-containing protein [[Clostridium] colinum]
MKNKYTILLIILCFLFSCIYITSATCNNDNNNFSINANQITDEFYKNLNTKENNFLYNNLTTNNKKTIDKHINNIQNNNSLININTADKETLKTLPNIGDTIAKNIIEYRENVSLFYNISDIKNVSRIGDKTYEKIKNLITVD